MSNFKPRLTKDGIWQNKYWYADNPFYPSYQLPNCTCYAWGRFWEITGKRPNLPTGDAGTWYPRNAASGVYEHGQTPRLGAIICWERPGKAGHVGVVEKILPNGDFIISNSNYQRPLPSYPPDLSDYFFTSTVHSSTMRPDWLGPSFKFQGFIYAPGIGPGPGGKLPPWLLFKMSQNNIKGGI